MRTHILLTVSLILVSTTHVFAQKIDRPNVVLMMADDQGWGETSYNGHPHLKTHVQDEMAATCLRFDRFYAAAPVCSPTRASVLTGRHPNRSGVFSPNHSTRPEEITIGQVLHKAGYRTAHFGKWHVGAVKKESPTNPGWGGFEEWLSHDNFFEMHPPLSHNGDEPTIHFGDSSNIIVDAAIDFLGRVRSVGDDPFFVVIWFGSPHSPYRGLAEDVGLFADVKGEELKHRFAEITAMDRSIGRFRQTLRDMHVADNTLLWYTSDNGMTVEGIPANQRDQQFNGGLRGRKGTLYEGGLKVPGIIEWPAVIQQPRSTSVPCVTSDIFPTLLSLLNLKSPDPNRPIDGVDLSPLILNSNKGNATLQMQRPPIGFWKYNRGPETKNERWMPAELTKGTTPTTRNPGIDFVNFKHPVANTKDFGGESAWMKDQFKLVYNQKKGVTELFNITHDPLEETDLSDSRPDVVTSLMAEMLAWQKSVEVSLTGADY